MNEASFFYIIYFFKEKKNERKRLENRLIKVKKK
jgi:hypothetical protein